MITFIVSAIALALGYFVYGKIVDRVFGSDESREVPSITQADGLDYVAMPTWKAFLIQFLNIAGTGPIFGAIAGFHATQSPVMARCVKSEKDGHKGFYGLMTAVMTLEQAEIVGVIVGILVSALATFTFFKKIQVKEVIVD